MIAGIVLVVVGILFLSMGFVVYGFLPLFLGMVILWPFGHKQDGGEYVAYTSNSRKRR